MEYIIIFLPLAAAIISGFFGKKIGERNSEIVTSLFVSISAILSIVIFYNVTILGYNNNLLIASWINSGSLNASWSINIDALSAVMLVVVTLISALVHIYSIGYMSQSVPVITGTIKENIRFGRDYVDETAIEEAVERLNSVAARHPFLCGRVYFHSSLRTQGDAPKTIECYMGYRQDSGHKRLFGGRGDPVIT